MDFLGHPIQLDDDVSQPLAAAFAGFVWNESGFGGEGRLSTTGKGVFSAITLAPLT